jgi:hypothetical protein
MRIFILAIVASLALAPAADAWPWHKKPKPYHPSYHKLIADGSHHGARARAKHRHLF